MKPKKKVPPYGKRKRAFDSVMKAYRESQIITISATQFLDGGKTSRYAAKPTAIDFRCDVDKVIKKCVRYDIARFYETYVYFDSEDAIEREMMADKMMGEKRHNLEQGMGAEFIRRHLLPTGKNGYFQTYRTHKGRR
jgi:hypothetical protein